MLGLRQPRTPAPFRALPRVPWFGSWNPEALAAFGWPQTTANTIPFADEWSVMGIPAAWRCATLISSSVAGLPLFAYSEADDGSEARMDPTPPMLRDPWPLLTVFDWTFGVVWSLLLRGNAYALPTDFDVATGWPRQLVLLNPDEVWVDIDPQTGLPRYNLGATDRNSMVTLGPGEIVHVRGITPPGSPVGVGVIEAHRRGFQTMLAFDSYAQQAFDAGIPSGLITVDRNELGREQADDLKARWLAAFSGTRTPAVLPRSITFEPLSFTPADMQYLEARKVGATEICWVFGVHPNMIGAPSGTSMTYQNLEATTTDFARLSLTPWSARIEQTLTKWTPRGQVVRFDYAGLLRGTTSERLAAYATGLDAGVYTLNEVRDLEHRPRYASWADEPFASPEPEAEPEPDMEATDE